MPAYTPMVPIAPKRLFLTVSVLAASLLPIGYGIAQETGIYVPADKRHQGLSKYDQLPFTDRKKGDPDRYRAINPNYVTKENGNYYFQLSAPPGTHYFDENLQDKGILTETEVKADLAQSKKGVDKGGKAVTYVFVKDKGFVLRSALPSGADIESGKWFHFPLKPGKHSLYDGTGIVRGTLAARTVRLNYGQQKQINGERCYYAFSTAIIPEGTTEKQGASGWILASAIVEGNDPQYSPEVVTKMQPSATADTTFTAYEVTGGDPEEKTGSEYTYGYADEKGGYLAYRVLPGVARDGRASIRATDYLKRNDDVINLGFNAAGVSNDTYRVSSAKRPLIFHRSSERDATINIDLYYAKDATHDGMQSVKKMVFVYGYVAETGGKRWGWIPLGALKPRL
jgi:hypothetical protein